MLRDKIAATEKSKDAFCSEIKFYVIVKVNVSEHFEYEASCQLPVLLLVIYIFILNMS